MKTVVRVLSLTALVTVGGCLGLGKPAQIEGVAVQAVDDGLVLKMSVPQRNYARGQSVPVTLVAENTTSADISIRADSGALVSVSLWRQGEAGWQHVKTFPSAAVMIPTTWILPAGKARTFTMDLPVTPDWPLAEYLRLEGRLNGRPCAAPAVMIQAWNTPEQCQREETY